MKVEPDAEERLALLQRQLERERRARRSAEQIGEAATAELWRTVQRLELAEAELRDRVETADISYALARSARADLDPDRILERALQALGQTLRLERTVVRLVDQSDTWSTAAQWTSGATVPVPTATTELDPGFAALLERCAEQEQSLWIDDVAIDERVPTGRVFASDLDCCSYGGVPLLVGGQVVGWLALHTARERRAWSPRDRAVAEALAHDLGGALLQARAHQRQIDTVRELQLVDQVKNELVWRVSHELRTPLASIRGYTELLIDGELGEPTPAQQRTLTVILRNCQRLVSLAENLLTLSRADGGEEQRSHGPVDLGTVLARVAERVTTLIDGRDLVVSLPESPQVPAASERLWGDEAEIEQVLLNLVGNAVKFTPDGGWVRLSVHWSSTSAVFEVSDSGLGIDPADHGRVFDRFFRTRQAQQHEVPGAGLGLALVDSVVRAHDGTVSLRSALGEGATFRVELPLGSR